MLFISNLLGVELVMFIGLVFIVCLLSLIVSLVAFIMEIQLSLQALRLELGAQTANAIKKAK